MNRKMFALVIVAVSVFLASPLKNALAVSTVTTWTDRTMYAPGEKVTLYIAFYNDNPYSVEINNITLRYQNWNAYVNGVWVGNETRIRSDLIGSKEKLVFSDITFNIPSDGRAVDTPVYISIGTDHGYVSGYAQISVIETPRYMEQVVTLFTVLVVLIIVCTIIIAATIFLSARKPQIMWSKEEKPQ